MKTILGLFYNFSQCSEALSQGHNGLRNAFVDEASLCESFEKKFLYTSKSYPNAVKLKVTYFDYENFTTESLKQFHTN